MSEEKEKPAWTKFNLGTIITLVAIIIASAGSWFTLKAQVDNLDVRIEKAESLQTEQDKSLQNVRLNGVQYSSDIKHIEERLISIDNKLDKLLVIP